MKKLYTLLALMASLLMGAQTVNIPDANFKARLIAMGLDTDGDGLIEYQETSSLTTLTLGPPYTITNLTGIASFVNLLSLDIDQQPIINLEVTLPNLISLDVSGNTTLVTLDCSGNHDLTTLNVQGCTNLTEIDADGCNFTSVNVTNMPNLERLNLYDTPITALNLNNTHNLKFLDVRSTYVAELTLIDFPQLTHLNASGYNLNSLTLSNIPLMLTFSQVASGTETVNISNMPALHMLSIVNNNLTGLQLSDLPALETLWLQNNQLASLTLSDLPALATINCRNNNIGVMDLSGLDALNSVNANDNPLQILLVKNGGTEIIGFNNLNNTLEYICADGQDIASLQAQFPAATVNDYCSFKPGGSYNTITGTVTFDYNDNGCDANDTAVQNTPVYLNGNTFFTNTLGVYTLYAYTGTYTVSTPVPPTGFIIENPSESIAFTELSEEATVDFCIKPDGNQPDLEVTILPVITARPGFDAIYKIVAHNKGNQIQSGVLNLQFQDEVLDYVASSLPLGAQSLNNVSWNFTNLYPFQNFEVTVTVNVNSPVETPAVNIDEVLTFIATVPIDEDEIIVDDNTFTLNQVVIGSYDPNDKQVAQGSNITPEQANGYLHYVVRFQNTGTAEAINVVVKDALAENLDWATFEPISASHGYRASLEGNIAEFYFEDINLPGEAQNEPASHGYVAFKIKPVTGAAVGDVFENTADIYFDYNAPIITNTVQTTVALLSNPEFDFSRYITAYPNPAKDVITLALQQDIQVSAINIYNMQGQLVLTTTGSLTVNTASLASGNYILKAVTDKGVAAQKIVRM